MTFTSTVLVSFFCYFAHLMDHHFQFSRVRNMDKIIEGISYTTIFRTDYSKSMSHSTSVFPFMLITLPISGPATISALNMLFCRHLRELT